ncbi:MAG: GGDEF domain-containing protein [Fibrobacter sp.]|jgi:diguanylate cyclase (GGDEF)-like protein|nr:GGDEF domain-containing protein [Fibrobacter sp.]
MMDLFGYIEISLFCIAVLVVMLIALRTSLSRLTNQTILTNVFGMVMSLFVFDLVSVLLVGHVTPLAMAVNHFCCMAFLVVNLILAFQWLRFVGYNLQMHFWHKKRKLLYMSIPIMAMFVLIFGSPVFGWIYRIDADNQRIRGTIYFVYIFVCCVYMLATGFIAGRRVFMKRYYSDRLMHVSLASVGVLPGFFLVVEYFVGMLPLSAYAMVVSVLLVFLELQSRMISTDPLTKLNNRNQLHVFLDSKLGQNSQKGSVYLFVLDLDKFKDINDNFGHQEGDRALNIVADVLKRTCGPKGCFISRFAGDEFNLVAELPDVAAAEAIKLAINYEIAQRAASLPYRLSLSIGYAASIGKGETPKDLFERADAALYKEKANR